MPWRRANAGGRAVNTDIMFMAGLLTVLIIGCVLAIFVNRQPWE